MFWYEIVNQQVLADQNSWIFANILHLEFLAGFCCNYLMRTTLTLFLAINALLLPIKVWAWGAAGHQLVAAGAFRQLAPQLKAEAIEVL